MMPMLPPLTEGRFETMLEEDRGLISVLHDNSIFDKNLGKGAALAYRIQVSGESFARTGVLTTDNTVERHNADDEFDWWREEMRRIGAITHGTRFDVGLGKNFESVVWPNLAASLVSENVLHVSEAIFQIINSAYTDVNVFGLVARVDPHACTVQIIETYQCFPFDGYRR